MSDFYIVREDGTKVVTAEFWRDKSKTREPFIVPVCTSPWDKSQEDFYAEYDYIEDNDNG